MEIPKRLWEVISQDFIIKLLKSKDLVIRQEYNSILVIVDKLTKWGYFILYIKEMSAKDLLKVYIKEMFTRHGVLIKIILDRDLRFVSAFQEVFTARQRT